MTGLIPKPLKMTEKGGYSEFGKNSKIYWDEALRKGADFLAREILGAEIIDFSSEDANIRVVTDKTVAQEGYAVECADGKLIVKASSFTGVFYAVQTLRQLVFFTPQTKADRIRIPNVKIEDRPRFAHRGLLFDEARYFFGKQNIKRILDLMAMYKLNVLHWHLTDDTGWRVEIKKYPLLTEIGSKRKDSSVGGWRNGKLMGKHHEGFYTQEDIREIVAYAQERGIMIIPEIDMPAHFAAAMAGYNYLGCREIPCEVHWFFGGNIPIDMGWKDWNRSACPGKETTYEFIFGVIDEIVELFPAPYFHIGGDEAPKDEWKKCPECQKKMKENNLKDVEDLQGYFNNRIAEYLESKNKRLIVWNEALSAGNLSKNVVGQYWTPTYDKNVKKHTKNGGQVIISKHQAFYFDMGYNQYPLKNTYKFEPVGKMIDKKQEDSILGLEGALWTEWISDMEKAEMQLFPRLQALAEVAWIPKGKRSFTDFLERLHRNNEILDTLKVNYAEDSVSMPKGLLKRKKELKLWYDADQHREVRLNREEKGKK
ncbi:MAG: beta-N-acetylhexosaminidase [Clostridia bacterium]|nr:beta-N-acetylhexosaminidase [Clostridia bacterium]